MSELYNFLLIFGLILFFIFLQLVKKYTNKPIAIFLIFPFLGLILFSYITFSKFKLNQYYQDAFKSPNQIKYCGYFTRYIQFEYQGRNAIIKETALLFQYRSDQTFLFSQNKHTLKKFPNIADLKPMQPICFQFSPEFKDQRNRYILTNFYTK